MDNKSFNLNNLKRGISSNPLRYVATYLRQDRVIQNKVIDILENLSINASLDFFSDYQFIRELPQEKYLVTTGFDKFQRSKIVSLGIEDDFDGIHIIDPLTNSRSKRSIFEYILIANNFNTRDVLIIGDDLNDEIRTAADMQMNAVIYDRLENYLDNEDITRINGYKMIIPYL